MDSVDSSSELISEALELNRALQELKAWSAERKRVLSEVEQFIQSALQANKMTLCRVSGTKRAYFTDRITATIQQDCSFLKRSILLMQVRERQINSRLKEISALTHDEKKSA